MIVVDASVLANALVLDGPAARRIAAEEIHAPHLVDAEVANALRGQCLGGHLAEDIAMAAITGLGQLHLTRHAHRLLLTRAWALRHNLTIYDALYVALAEGLGAALVTADARIAGCPGVRTSIEVIPPA
ncbi:MAG: type II toxin-antitoxin system VapC family toxin [Dermatophilaceae bacterium]